MDILGGSERVCPICKKIFWAHDEHVFKRKKSNLTYTFCSWSCMKKFDEGWKTQGRGKRVGKEMSRIIELNELGLSVPEMARELGCTPNNIKYHLKKLGLWRNRNETDAVCSLAAGTAEGNGDDTGAASGSCGHAGSSD